MVRHDKFTEDLLELEQLLVRQFRSLQELIDLAMTERNYLLANDPSVMRCVEDKEALLDQLSLMEDNRRRLVQDLALMCDIQSDTTSIRELLPHLRRDAAERIDRMVEGISSLASQARDLNRANQALSFTKLEWIRSFQSFLIGIAQPEAGYHPPGVVIPATQHATGFGVEFRA